MRFFKRQKKKRTTYHPMGTTQTEAIWKNKMIPIGIELRIARLDDKVMDQELLAEILDTWIPLVSHTFINKNIFKDEEYSTVETKEQTYDSEYSSY